jgi:hypothetical protein
MSSVQSIKESNAGRASALAVMQAIADPLASLERILHLSVVQNRPYATFSERPSDANQEIMTSNPVVLGPDTMLREAAQKIVMPYE